MLDGDFDTDIQPAFKAAKKLAKEFKKGNFVSFPDFVVDMIGVRYFEQYEASQNAYKDIYDYTYDKYYREKVPFFSRLLKKIRGEL